MKEIRMQQSQATSFVTHSAVHWLAISLSHEWFYNFMRVHFQIDSSLIHSSGVDKNIQLPFKIIQNEITLH